MKKFLFTSAFIFLASCGKSNDDRRQDNNNFNYEHAGQNCSTAPHRFATQQGYCDGLRDENLNNHCAIQSRYQSFQQDCPGQRWQR